MQQVVGVLDVRHERRGIPPAVASSSEMAGDGSVHLSEPSPQRCGHAGDETRAELLCSCREPRLQARVGTRPRGEPTTLAQPAQ